jgi:hypothetical protein
VSVLEELDDLPADRHWGVAGPSIGMRLQGLRLWIGERLTYAAIWLGRSRPHHRKHRESCRLRTVRAKYGAYPQTGDELRDQVRRALADKGVSERVPGAHVGYLAAIALREGQR